MAISGKWTPNLLWMACAIGTGSLATAVAARSPASAPAPDYPPISATPPTDSAFGPPSVLVGPTQHDSAPDTAPESVEKKGKVGAKLLLRQGPCFIEGVLEGSPAEAAGLRAGDRLISVDNESVAGMNLKEITQRIMGPIGSTVKLKVQSPGDQARTVAVVRAEVKEPPKKIKAATSALPRLRAFSSRGETNSVQKTLEEIDKKGDASEKRTAYPLVVATLSRSDEIPARQMAETYLPAALNLAPTDYDLSLAVRRLYLEAKPPRYADSVSRSEEMLVKLATLAPSRERDRAKASYLATLGFAELRSDRVQKGKEHLKEAGAFEPGLQLAGIDAKDQTVWSRRVGPMDHWAPFLQYYLDASELELATQLLLDTRIWDDTEVVAKWLEQLTTRRPVNTASFSGPAWPISSDNAPPLQLQTTDGRTISLEDLRGKVVLISLWATWCGPCHMELEEFKGLYERMKGKPFEILAVSVDEDTSLVAPFVNKRGLNFPAGLAPARPALYRTTNVPITYLVDQQGKLIWSHIGFSKENFPEVEAKINELIDHPDSATPKLISSAYNLNRLELRAHAPLPRVSDVAVGKTPEGPQIWAITSNGKLETFRFPTSADTPARLVPVRSDAGFGGFRDIEAIDRNGDGISERLLYQSGKSTIIIEDQKSSETLEFIPGIDDIDDVVVLDLDGDKRDELIIDYREAGVQVINPGGRLAWHNTDADSRAFTMLSAGKRATPQFFRVIDAGVLQSLGPDGGPNQTWSAGGLVQRAIPLRSCGKQSAVRFVIQDHRSPPLQAVDLDGDSCDELVGVTGAGLLYVYSGDGQILARATFAGQRLELAVADLDQKPGQEIVIVGEGLGVAVLGLSSAH